MRNAPNINYLWASLIVEELIRNGIDTFCISPGSRSTPLTSAVAENPAAKKVVHFDERGSAFHALGYARASGKPAVVITTSGTAVANLLPAVIEAASDFVPMILLTADRPFELRDTGANQAIDQVKLFSDYIRWQTDLPCPDLQITPQTVLTTIDQAIYRTLRGPRGPVHVNCMFREPLAPIDTGADFQKYLAPLQKWISTQTPWTQYTTPAVQCSEPELSNIAAFAGHFERGLMIVGGLDQSSAEEKLAIAALAEHLKWPLIADITAGITQGATLISHADALLMSPRFQEQNQPEVVIQLGGRVVSKRLMEYLNKAQPRHWIVVASHPFRQDPHHSATLRVEADLGLFCQGLSATARSAAPELWLESWKSASQKVGADFDRYFAEQAQVTEPGVARAIAKQLPPHHALFISSSMPIRDMDTYAGSWRAKNPSIGSNRGASGIDGVLASAAGFIRGHGQPGTLLIGDLSLLHDVNSLALAAELPLVIVVINNDGGGIFSFLPISQHAQVFEKYFGTPHGVRFGGIAESFRMQYAAPRSQAEFRAAYQGALELAQNQGRATLIEVQTERTPNHQLHVKLNERVRDLL